MNSPHLGTDNVLTPITEAENLQTDEAKQWNKSLMEKRVIPLPHGTSSPKLEQVNSSVSPLNPLKSSARQNGVSYKKKLRLDDEEYDSLEMACNLASELPDDCDAFGKHVAAQLRIMTKMQKFIAERLISEICFRGQIQHLSLSTNIVNSTQQQQQQQPAQSHQAPVFPRPPHVSGTLYTRTPDYMMLHQQGLRGLNPLPPFQTFMQPPEPPLEPVGGANYNNS